MRDFSSHSENTNDIQQSISPGSGTNKQQKLNGMHILAYSILIIALLFFSAVSTVVCLMTVLFFIIEFSKKIFSIRKSPLSLMRKSLIIALLLFGDIWFAGILIISIDAEPIPNDYTVADLRSAEAQYEKSYDVFKRLGLIIDASDHGYPTGLTKQDTNEMEAVIRILKKNSMDELKQALRLHADSIEKGWECADKSRDIIKELNTFYEIADLSEPKMDAQLVPLNALNKLSIIYAVYVCLQAEEGKGESAADILVEFDNVVRKFSTNARHVVEKMVCFKILSMNIETANFIINNTPHSSDAALVLAEHFKPFTNECMSLRNSMITEYLIFRNTLVSLPFVGQRPYIKNLPFLKRNSTIRVCRNWYDHRIEEYEGAVQPYSEELSPWPWIYPDLGPVVFDANGRLPWFYEKYNKVGSLLLKLSMASFTRLLEIRTDLRTRDKLLQIVIDLKLKKRTLIESHYNNGENIIDLENKVIYSIGRDGQPKTPDDIILSINPDVLELPRQ